MSKLGLEPNQVKQVASTLPSASSVTAGTCEDEALKQLHAILLLDKKDKVLARLMELTSMRLARRALKDGDSTLEELANKTTEHLQSEVDKIPSTKPTQDQLKAIYDKYAKGQDIQAIQDDLNNSLKTGKTASYWAKGKTRLRNGNASAFVLAMAIGEKDSGLSEADAATIWVMEKMRLAGAAHDPARYKVASAKYGEGNLLNISTRVARYLGLIAGGEKATVPELDHKIGDEVKSLQGVIDQASSVIQNSLEACIKLRHKDDKCVSCAATAVTNEMAAFNKEHSTFDDIQKSLLEVVNHSDNMTMESGLKAKMGEVHFDLSNIATGDVPEFGNGASTPQQKSVIKKK